MVREIRGWGPGVEAAEPRVVPSLAKRSFELQQAGTDAALVVSVERFLPDGLPRVQSKISIPEINCDCRFQFFFAFMILH